MTSEASGKWQRHVWHDVVSQGRTKRVHVLIIFHPEVWALLLSYNKPTIPYILEHLPGLQLTPACQATALNSCVIEPLWRKCTK